MAKISGGRNMFGMMGMATPFGAPAPKTGKVRKAKSEVQNEQEEPESFTQPLQSRLTGDSVPQTASSVPHAIPIPGMSQPGALPVKVGDEEEDSQTEVPVAATKPSREDSSIAESDYTDEQNVAPRVDTRGFEQIDENKPKSPTLELSESEPENIEREDNMDLGPRSTLEGEVTGYEADEDVSDRGAVPRNDLLDSDVPSAPAVPTAVPPIPEHLPPHEPKSVPAPQVPAPQPPVQPPPPHTRAPPPIPGAPPVPGHDTRAPPPPPPDAPRAPPPIPTEAPLPPVNRSNAAEPQDLPRPPPTLKDALITPTSKAPPPVPTGPPPKQDQAEAFEDSSDEESELRDVPSGHLGGTPDRSKTFAHPPPVPQVPVSRANTVDSIRRTSTDLQHKRRSSDLTRTKSLGKAEQLQADSFLPVLQDELRDVSESSGWWIKDAVPDCLDAHVGIDFIFEVDRHKLTKRGNREVIVKDYYILFHDLSQIVLELQYDSDDPRTTLSVSNAYVKPPVVSRRDLLDRYHAQYGAAVVDVAQSLVHARVTNGFVNAVFNQVNKSNGGGLLPPIGSKSYGVTVYKNQNGSTSKNDEVKPGDILCMKNAKFTVHGLGGLSSKSVVYGDGNQIYSGVVIEVDHKKEKLKVLESDDSGNVKKDSIKLNDLKSGRLRIFRIVDRQFIGW